MSVRLGEARDRVRAVELLADSHRAAGFPFEFVPAFAAGLFTAHCEEEHRLALVLEAKGRAEGLLLAHCGQHPFGPFRAAMETVWWIDPAHRGRAAIEMLAAYEAWARARNCAFVSMASLATGADAGRLYQRRGYAPLETHYLKAL